LALLVPASSRPQVDRQDDEESYCTTGKRDVTASMIELFTKARSPSGVPYPVGAMEVVRQELRPDVARQLVLFGQNITAASAVQAGVFDETQEPIGSDPLRLWH
jgi:hypothetical protein